MNWPKLDTKTSDACLIALSLIVGGILLICAGHPVAGGCRCRMTVYRKQGDGRWLLSRGVHTLSAVA